MKRAVPQDANSVSFSSIEPDAAEEAPRQTLPEENRRVSTSAAMIGLAISVGAYGVLTPQQANAAINADPVTSDAVNPDSATSAAMPSADVSTVSTVASPVTLASSSSEPLSRTLSHTVQDGQTLWKIAELYGIDAAKLASSNGLQVNAVLSVGQTLQVSVASGAVLPAVPQSTVRALPDLKQVPAIPVLSVASNAPVSRDVEPQSRVKAQQGDALQTLKQSRDRLKQSLAELKSEESKSVVSAVPTTELPNLTSYQVQAGETLSSIAKSHNVSMAELVRVNGLVNPDLLGANQVLRIPQVALAAPAAMPQAVPTVKTAAMPASVPVVPSLAATQNLETSAPLAVGGDAQQFAYSNGSLMNRGGSSTAVDVRSPNPAYVSSLMSEISRLRDRYQASGPARSWKAAESSAPVAIGSARRVNPEFKANRQLNGLRPPVKTPRSKDQLVAAASVGSESYTPLLRSSMGRQVSPSVPSLGRSEAYLPNATERMKGYMWPAKGVLTSGYGPRWGRMHKGIDIAGPVGTPIISAAAGKVITAGWNDGGYGNLVEVQHSDGSVTLYGHNNRILVRVGQQVAQGQQIAEMGSTGFSTGPHSHFEVHLPGRGAVNPVAYLSQSRS